MPVSRYPTALTVTTCTVFFVLFAALLPSPALAQEALSDTERTIVAAVDADVAAGLILLEAAVNINSGSMNAEGVREVGRLFRGELDALGFETRWVDGTPFERGGHLVAERPGNGPTILLIGHLDTVFELDSPFQRYELLNDSTARGPGIIDMKGGDVIIVQALKALDVAGALDDLHIIVVMTGDEEKSGRPFSISRRDLIEAADAADVALSFEDGDGNPATAVVARRGYSGWTLTVTGQPAHSSQVFREDIGYGAIYEAARILTRFQEELAGEKYLTFNPGVILGGTSLEFDPAQARGEAFGKQNVIAEHAVASGDLRMISLEQRDRARERMRAIVADHLPHTNAAIEFTDGYPPMPPTEGNERLLALLDQVSRDLGQGPVTAVDPRRAGAADIAFTTGRVEMALDGLGLMGEYGHTVEEVGDLRSLPLQSKRTAVLLYRLSRVPQ
jgi:glutamate carboxypeptidase